MAPVRTYEFQLVGGVVLAPVKNDQYNDLMAKLEDKVESVAHPQQYMTVQAAFYEETHAIVTVLPPRKCVKCVDASGECIVPIPNENWGIGDVVRDKAPVHGCLRCGVLKVPCSLRIGTRTGRRGRWVLPEPEIDQSLASLGRFIKLANDMLYSQYRPEDEVLLSRLRDVNFVVSRIREAKSRRPRANPEPVGTVREQMSVLWHDLLAVAEAPQSSVPAPSVVGPSSPVTGPVVASTVVGGSGTTGEVNVTTGFVSGGTAGSSSGLHLRSGTVVARQVASQASSLSPAPEAVRATKRARVVDVEDEDEEMSRESEERDDVEGEAQ